MKKLHLGFGIAALCLAAVGLLHGGVAWIVAAAVASPATSFPAWANFVLIVLCYAIGLVALLCVWLIAWLVVRAVSAKRCKK